MALIRWRLCQGQCEGQGEMKSKINLRWLSQMRYTVLCMWVAAYDWKPFLLYACLALNPFFHYKRDLVSHTVSALILLPMRECSGVYCKVRSVFQSIKWRGSIVWSSQFSDAFRYELLNQNSLLKVCICIKCQECVRTHSLRLHFHHHWCSVKRWHHR